MHMCGWSIIVLVLTIFGTVIYTTYFIPPLEKPPIKDEWWGRGEEQQDSDSSEEIIPTEIKIEKSVITDLYHRLDNTRFFESLENVKFHYGFRVDHMKVVVKYWQKFYKWETHEKNLNKFPHYKTRIEGLDVHFIHVKPKLKQGQTSKPILMVHGWPGSFFEFYKIIPMLVNATQHNGTDSDVFEVICPSIPGYGFSEAPHKQGFDQVDAARVFLKLMHRLGFDSFYTQGGDWGSFITSNMAIMNDSAVRGIHLNFFAPDAGALSFGRRLVGTVFPSLVVKKSDEWKLYPILKHLLFYLEEFGYFHLQATKPDTIGHALNDSPVGLAAYILEKFSSWTNYERNINRVTGALTEKIHIEELLTNVMIYWVTGSITSSMRFYKECMHSSEVRIYEKLPVSVPAGLACFPHEIVATPERFAAGKYQNIVQYTDMTEGGHFAAMEVPERLVRDIRNFVRKVESNIGKDS